MVRKPASFGRREYGIGLGTLGLSLVAGCLGDDGSEGNGNGDAEDEPETGDQGDESGESNPEAEDEDDDGESPEDEADEETEPTLTIHLANEDGDSVSKGVRVTIDADEAPIRYIIEHEIADGIAEPESIDPGPYTIAVDGDEFETVEESVTLEAGDHEELTIELEGATGDGEAADEDASDEGAADEESDDGEHDDE